MPELTLRALKAKHGDSLLLICGETKVLIDGGPAGVYNRVLRDQLLALDSGDDDQPRINLLMISHIDADHIEGVLDLTDELIEARDEEREPIVKIDRAWHNSFSDTIAQAGIETSSRVRASAAEAASALEDLSGLDFDPHESKLVLSSVKQGRQLRLDLKALNIDINQRFKERLVIQGNARKPFKKGKLQITVIGPAQKQLDSLRKTWKKKLVKLLEKEAKASLAAAKDLDTSVSNLASIVAIAETDTASVLLTGDARGDMILEWLEDVGRLATDETVHFDIIKLPHHGSDRNISPDFFKRVTADHYIFSGNGGHGNPEPATFEMLFKARPAFDYKVHITHTIDEIKANSKFQKAGNVRKLDAVLATYPGGLNTLNVPKAGETHIEIEI